jgi:hypothetical protein
MAGVVVGIIRSIDETRRVIVIGGAEFAIPESISLAGLVAGISVTLTYELSGGKSVATTVRTNPR